MPSNRIGLMDFINQVRLELLTQHPPKDQDVPLLLIDEIEIEMSVGVTTQGGTKLSLYVLDANGSVEGEKVQKVRVKMSPLIDRETREKMALGKLTIAQRHQSADTFVKGPEDSDLIDQE